MKRNQKKLDEQYLRECLTLAAPFRGRTFPNPMVGCVIVKDDRIIGRGAHEGIGLPHAEVNALKDAGANAAGATLYVNLEPCCHHGNTPPCTDAIIKAGIARVVFSHKDPNPLVACGNSERTLKKAGIAVTRGILQKEAEQLNEKFIAFHLDKTPFVSLKLAASLDGRIATRTGESKWITGPEARQFVQMLRCESDAIAVGVNTVIEDDPELLVRVPRPKGYAQPLRVIFDSALRTPLKARIVRTRGKGSTLILTTAKASAASIAQFEHHGVEVHVCPKDKHGHIDMNYAIAYLGEREITSLLIEGGGEIAASALEAGAVDKLYYFMAPLIIGGREARPSVAGIGPAKLNDALRLKGCTVQYVGTDLLIEGYTR